MILQSGWDVQRDLAKSIACLLEVGGDDEQGDAQFLLGSMIHHGIGQHVNREEALTYLRITSLEEGDANAQEHLGVMLLPDKLASTSGSSSNGYGRIGAIQHLQKAASQS